MIRKLSQLEFDSVRTFQLQLLLGASFLASYGIIFNYFQHYGFSSSAVIFLLIPLAVYIAKPETRSYRYAIPAILTLAMFAITGVETLLILALGFTCFFLVESRLGKLNLTAPFLLLLTLPRMGYLFDIFSFPIRLQLTSFAGFLLQITGLPNTVRGNLIDIQGEIFTVDTACMGLHMTIIGFFSVFLILTHFEKKYKHQVNLKVILPMIFGVTLAIILANLVRIIWIIQVRAYAGTIEHELIGLITLIFMVIIPAYLLLQKKVKNTGKSVPMFPKNSPWLRREIRIVLNIILPLSLLTANIKLTHFSGGNTEIHLPKIQLLGYETVELPNQILQLSSTRALIYIKNQEAYRITNHNPLICWEASGYEIIYENVISVGKQKVFFAEMSLDGKKYYGTWWYDNGTHKTISQTDWRWRSLFQHQDFKIINVTCRNQKDLKRETKKLLHLDLFETSRQLTQN